MLMEVCAIVSVCVSDTVCVCVRACVCLRWFQELVPVYVIVSICEYVY